MSAGVWAAGPQLPGRCLIPYLAGVGGRWATGRQCASLGLTGEEGVGVAWGGAFWHLPDRRPTSSQACRVQTAARLPNAAPPLPLGGAGAGVCCTWGGAVGTLYGHSSAGRYHTTEQFPARCQGFGQALMLCLCTSLANRADCGYLCSVAQTHARTNTRVHPRTRAGHYRRHHRGGGHEGCVCGECRRPPGAAAGQMQPGASVGVESCRA